MAGSTRRSMSKGAPDTRSRSHSVGANGHTTQQKPEKSPIFSRTGARRPGWQKHERYHGKYVPFKKEDKQAAVTPQPARRGQMAQTPGSMQSKKQPQQQPQGPQRGRVSTVTRMSVQARLSKSPAPPGRRLRRDSMEGSTQPTHDGQLPVEFSVREEEEEAPQEVEEQAEPVQEVQEPVEKPATPYLAGLLALQHSTGEFKYLEHLHTAAVLNKKHGLPTMVALLQDASAQPGPHLAMLFDVMDKDKEAEEEEVKEEEAPKSCCPPGSHGFLASDHKDEGTKTTVNDVAVYEAGEFKDSVVLVLPDVWGWDSGRLRAIVDESAKKDGLFYTIPKILTPFEGGTDDDGLPPQFNIPERFPDLGKAVSQWKPTDVLPKIDAVLKGYKERGATKAGIISYCYGVWIGFHVTRGEPALPIVAAVGSHPSLILEKMILEGDHIALAEGVKTPWLLQPAGEAGKEGSDGTEYDADGAIFQKLEEQLPGKNVSTRYSTQAHGFVTRGAITRGTAANGCEEDDVRSAVAAAVGETVAFLKEHGL